MTSEMHLSTGAVALDSVPADEAAEFTDHLTTCSSCSVEIAGFRETAAMLSLVTAQAPPAALRESVLAAIKVTPQLPPLTGSTPTGSTHQPAGGPTAGPEGAVPLGRHRHSDLERRDPADADPAVARRPWYRRPQAFLAAAAAVVIIAGGVTAVALNSGSTTQTASGCVTAAADKQVIAPTVGTGGDVVLAPSCGQAMVTVAGLPALPDGKVYQLWVMQDTKATSVGVMTMNANGSMEPVTAAVSPTDTDIGISVEPGPGPSPAPTSAPIWVVHL